MSPASGERAYIGLGANLGAPAQQIQHAIRALGGLPATRLLAESALYRSAPWGLTEQPDFLNAIVAIDTGLAPQALIESMLSVERALGRLRDGARWGPRRIDLDLILYGERSFATTDLCVPHPRFQQRAFVLLPLIEVAAQLDDRRLPQWRQNLSNLPHDDVVRMPVESTAAPGPDRMSAHSHWTSS